MSSLQKQLAAIAATSNHELDLKAQKSAHGKSLLFEPRQASTQSFDTIYQICVEGFEALCRLDARFTVFGRSIFSAQSKSEDRSQMTQGDNDELDRILESFLGLIGARLLLKPALKAVEWLIRRFRVHEQNTDYLILTFLPYYSTPVFKTVLSILPKQLSSPFRFLYPYVNTLSNPARSIVVQTAVQQQTFLAALNSYVLQQAKARHHYHALITFWATVVVQAVDAKLQSSQAGRLNVQQQREDDLLMEILPVLNEGLNTAKAPELAIGCYMIVVVLTSKLDLEDNVLDSLMVEICKNWTAETLDAGLGCLAAIAEHRQQTLLPGMVLKAAFRIDGLASKLAHMSAQQSIDKLIAGLSVGFVERYSSSNAQAVRSFFTTAFESSNIRPEAKKAIASYLDQQDKFKEFKLLLPSEEVAEVEEKAPAEQDVLSEEESEAVTAEDGAAQAQKFQSLTSKAAGRELGPSFLVPSLSDSEDFCLDLLEAYKMASGDKTLKELFFRLEIFADHSRHLAGLRKISFLLRFACASKSPATRYSAVRDVEKTLRNNSESGLHYQELIPSALVLLADGSSRVRRAAADFIKEIHQRHENRSKSTEEIVWAKGSLYQSVNAGAALSTKTTNELLARALIANLEECVVDATQIGRVLRDNLDDSLAHSAPESGTKSKRLKSAARGEILAYLSRHALEHPSVSFKYRLTQMLNNIGKSGSHYRSKFLLVVAQQWVSLSEKDILSTKLDSLSREDVDKVMMAVVYPSDQEALSWLLSVAQGKSGSGRADLTKAALYHLRNIWTLLKPEKQKEVAVLLLNGTVDSDQSWRALASETFANITISPATFVSLLETIHGGLDAGVQPGPKRRKIDGGPSVAEASTVELQSALLKLTLVLEQIESAKVGADLQLFYALFRILQELQALKAQQVSDLSYIKGLVLSNISSIMVEIERQTPNAQFDASAARPDLLVECIQDSPDAHARNSAMLLLASLAKRVPQRVLHTVMPIFTLMSSSTARQGDDFSIHVVNQTIREVVPLLAETLRKQNKDLVSATSEVLLSFAAAFDHIHASRRLQLFALLVSSLGPEESLFAVLAALADRSPNSQEVARFATQLFRQFSGAVCMSTLSKYLDLCLGLSKADPAHHNLIKSEDPQNTSQLVALLPGLIRDHALQLKIRNDLRSGTNSEQLRQSFARSLELVIKLSQAGKGDAKMQAQCPKVLEALLKLVPLDEFLKATLSLIDGVEPDLCRSILRAMELQIKAEANASQSSRQAALGCSPRLIKILKTSDHSPLKHSAVACLDQICDKFGKGDLAATFQAAEAVSSQQCIAGKDRVLRTLSLHCLATTTEVLGNDFIPLLQRSVDAAAQCLEDSLVADGSVDQSLNINMHNAACALFIAIVDHLAFMVSAKALGVIFRLSQSSAQVSLSVTADENRSHMLQLVAAKIDVATVAEVSETTWASACDRGYESLQEHIGNFRQAIDNHSKSVVTKNVRVCFQFFLRSLDFRRSDGSSFDESQILEIEKSVLGAFIALTLKINDVALRPLFTQLIEWTAGPTKADTKGRKMRSTTFFGLLLGLSNRLKSLITSYFGYVVNQAQEILLDVADDNVTLVLQTTVLKALGSSFANDQDEFWQAPSRFDPILPALMRQMTRSPVQLSRISGEVIPTIVELAAVANSNEHLKALNASLLKQFRSENSRLRLAAVRCQMQLTERLGEDWLSLLPEMLPAISELQDDDDEKVERETHRWVKAIEAVLGESLDSMLQ